MSLEKKLRETVFTPLDEQHLEEIESLGETTFREQRRAFGIKTKDRRNHIYIIGKTGTGKSTLLKNMVIQDLRLNHGVALIDPHGDLVEDLLNYIPKTRTNEVVYFNPADKENPVAINILEAKGDDEKHLVASSLISVFRHLWRDFWGPRLEHILYNCVLALMDTPGQTLLGVYRMLVDNEFRKLIVGNIQDPIVKMFWVDDYENYDERFRKEIISPVQNKVGQLLTSPQMRNIVGQPKSSVDFGFVMDNKRILLANLSKGKVCGLIRCGTCGMGITAERKTKYQKNGNVHHYTYYRCSRKNKAVKCSEPPIREELLDKQLSNLLQPYKMPPDWATEISKMSDRDEKEAIQSASAIVQGYKAEIQAISQKLQRLLNAYLDQDIEREAYRLEKANLLSRKKSLEEKMAEVANGVSAWVEPLRDWLKDAQMLNEIHEDAPLSLKKSFAKKIFGLNLTLHAREARGVAEIQWASVAEAHQKIGKTDTCLFLVRGEGLEPPAYPV